MRRSFLCLQCVYKGICSKRSYKNPTWKKYFSRVRRCINGQEDWTQEEKEEALRELEEEYLRVKEEGAEE